MARQSHASDGVSAIRRTYYQFPRGIPAFEHIRRFCLIENPAHAPLVVLEGDRLELADEEAAQLGPCSAPGGLILLAVLTFREGLAPTANLLAPVVLNPETRVGLQSVQAHLPYSHLHPLRQEPSCS